jgi:hypothetical protein
VIRTNILVLIPMAAGFVAGLLATIVGVPQPTAVIVGVAVAAISDLAVRVVMAHKYPIEWEDEGGWGKALVSPRGGAHLWFVPVWVVALVGVVVLVVQGQ